MSEDKILCLVIFKWYIDEYFAGKCLNDLMNYCKPIWDKITFFASLAEKPTNSAGVYSYPSFKPSVRLAVRLLTFMI